MYSFATNLHIISAYQRFIHMCVHMNIMAKTIRISNEAYNELKIRKAKSSFNDLVINMLHRKNDKMAEGLRSCFGTLRKDKEFETIEEALEKGWRKWSKKVSYGAEE